MESKSPKPAGQVECTYVHDGDGLQRSGCHEVHAGDGNGTI